MRSLGVVVLLLLVLQLVTGFTIALHYAPQTATAWASIVFFEERIRAGAFIRGLHAWGASAIVVAAVIHYAVCAWRGSYRRPQHGAWAVGLLLGLLILLFAHTGYVLPWDQKGYWSTKVATGIAGATPVVGGAVQRVALGGEDAGNMTLTRFYAVHTIMLPLLLVGLVALHVRFLKREEAWWPRQALRDFGAFAAVFGLLALLAWTRRASLEAPADPASDFDARPEWYFLPLYQALKLFPGRLEFVGSELLPAAIFVTLLALPWILEKRGTRAARLVAFAPLGAAIVLGALALNEDANDETLQRRRAEAARDARLARRLFRDEGGVPPEGPLALLDRYPPRLGARVFKERCASCHAGRDLKGPDLTGYLSQRWLEDVIRDPTPFFKQDSMGKTAATPAELAALAVFVMSLESPERAKTLDAGTVAKGRRLFDDKECSSCHDTSPGKSECAPNLWSYGSEGWLVRFVKKPTTFYDEKHDKMPAFEGKLSDAELRAVVVHLRALRNPETDE